MENVKIVRSGAASARKYASDRGVNFRAPDYTTSLAGLLGELASTAGGVYLLDDLSKFDISRLEIIFGYFSEMQESHRPTVFLSYTGKKPLEALRAFGVKFSQKR